MTKDLEKKELENFVRAEVRKVIQAEQSRIIKYLEGEKMSENWKKDYNLHELDEASASDAKSEVIGWNKAIDTITRFIKGK